MADFAPIIKKVFRTARLNSISYAYSRLIRLSTFVCIFIRKGFAVSQKMGTFAAENEKVSNKLNK